jgi:pyridoxal phosphate enzyme (YggS family)
MSPIHQQLDKLKAQLPEHVQLVAVSKTKPVSVIMHAYKAGQRVFGENKVQELQAKYPEMPKDIRWHMIGHLQTNKVKYIAPWIDMIHSVDRMKLLRTINKEAAKAERTIDCLLQFHIAEEDTKFGLDMKEAEQMLESESFQDFKNVRIRGVMGMATFTEDMAQVRREFKHLKSIFDQLKSRFFSDTDAFSEISMGMSGDYKIAIEEGATIVRIGSTIFGARDTH